MSIWEYQTAERPNRVSRFLLALALFVDFKHWDRTRQIQYFKDRWIILISDAAAGSETERGK